MIHKFGDSGHAVKVVQEQLAKIGLYTGDIDGVFGYGTFNAVRRFQLARGLIADGVVGPNTMRSLNNFQTSTNALESIWYYEGAYSDFETNVGDIDVIVPFWFQITADGEVYGEVEQQVLDLAKQSSTEVHGLVSNFEETNFSKELIDGVLQNDTARENLISNITSTAVTYNLAGINLDLEFISPENREVFTQFVQKLFAGLQAQGKKLTISVPAKSRDVPDNWFHGAFDYQQLATSSDQLFIMTYDYHWFGGEPGPIAPITWVRSVLNYAVSIVSREKIKIGTPVYGYDWPVELQDSQPIATGKAAVLSYEEVIGKAQLYDVQIQWDEEAKAPYYNYEVDGQEHQVWFENASSFSWKYELARGFDIGGFAAWRLGQEDDQIWSIV